VGWSMGERLTEELALKALEMALGTRKPAPGLLHHSDRGSQYTGLAYRHKLEGAAAISSMSRKGNCWGNAVVESSKHHSRPRKRRGGSIRDQGGGQGGGLRVRGGVLQSATAAFEPGLSILEDKFATDAWAPRRSRTPSRHRGSPLMSSNFQF